MEQGDHHLFSVVISMPHSPRAALQEELGVVLLGALPQLACHVREAMGRGHVSLFTLSVVLSPERVFRSHSHFVLIVEFKCREALCRSKEHVWIQGQAWGFPITFQPLYTTLVFFFTLLSSSAVSVFCFFFLNLFSLC